MSLSYKPLRKLRIIAVPLTRPNAHIRAPTEAKKILTYYQFQMSSPKSLSKKEGEGEVEEKPKSGWLPKEGVVQFLQNKAAETWTGFGQKNEGSWQLKVYRAGEHMVDRMDFEELALKGVDPSLGPSLTHFSPAVESDSEKGPKIPLIYPKSLGSDSQVLLELKRHLEHRMPKHRKGFYMWMVIAPLTTPFMIIPVIPNLPFFFCAWRSWTHYKAYRATQYLQDFLINDAIVPEGSQALDALFQEFSPTSTQSESSDSANSLKSDMSGVIEDNKAKGDNNGGGNGHEHQLLLRKDAVPALVSLFGLQGSASTDLYRAIEQARLRIETGQLDK